MALQAVIGAQNRPWNLQTLNLQELFDPLDIFRKLTGIRMQDLYNNTLKRGWTIGSPQLMRAMHGVIRLYHKGQVKLLETYWREHPTDLVVSLIPNFNRALHASLESVLPGVPLMTIMTDFADFPPHFWIEKQEQYLVCGTEHAVEQARAMNYSVDQIFRTSGMILHPKFYAPIRADRREELLKLGLDPDLRTGLVLFGGQGSTEMEGIVKRIGESKMPVQLILLCGHNRKLVERLRAIPDPPRMHILGFTHDVPFYMFLSDFFIGKPGPGSISEALFMNLPVIVERNAWTLPQERYNATWIEEQGMGMVLRSFRGIDAAVAELLQPLNYNRFRRNAEAVRNQAVFEIPEFMESILSKATPVIPRERVSVESA